MAKTLAMKHAFIFTVFVIVLIAATSAIKPVTGNDESADVAEYGGVNPVGTGKPYPRVIQQFIFSRRAGGPLGKDCTYDLQSSYSCSECNHICIEAYRFDSGACDGWWPLRHCVCHRAC